MSFKSLSHLCPNLTGEKFCFTGCWKDDKVQVEGLVLRMNMKHEANSHFLVKAGKLLNLSLHLCARFSVFFCNNVGTDLD